MLVELIYDSDCPNVADARVQLMRAFAYLGLTPSWKEWDRNSKESPAYAKGYGSPTILIDGKDCVGLAPSDANSCRIYESSEGAKKGIPSLDIVISALKGNHSRGENGDGVRKHWLSSAAMFPSIGLVFLPKLACPACWPAYAGVLSSVGLGFLLKSRYLFAVTVIFLVVALFALGFRACTRRSYGPFSVGVIAAAMILIGKFVLESDLTMYVGVGGLVGASVWNSWPRGAAKTGSCPSCVQTEPSLK